MKYILLLIAASIMLCSNTQARLENARKYINHHRFEISVGYGAALSESITGNIYKTDGKYWETKTMQTIPLGLTYYPIKRLGVSALGNVYEFEHKYNMGSLYGYGGKNAALSLVVGINYDLPYRNSIFYGGANIGHARILKDQDFKGPLYEGNGIEWNIHVGYKLALVKNRFFYFIEAGRTSLNIKPDISTRLSLKYGLDFYSVMMGLKFKI